jgi:hypothetical protein
MRSKMAVGAHPKGPHCRAHRRDDETTPRRHTHRRDDAEGPGVAAHAGATTRAVQASPRTPARRRGGSGRRRARRRDDEEGPGVAAHAGATTRAVRTSPRTPARRRSLRGPARHRARRQRHPGPSMDPCLTFFAQNGCPASRARRRDGQDRARGPLPLPPTSHG